MIAYLLVMLLGGQPILEPIRTPTVATCQTLGENLVTLVRLTDPGWGARMSWQCRPLEGTVRDEPVA